MKNYFHILFFIFFVCFWHEANGNNTFEGTRTRVAYNEINLPQQVQLLGGRGIKNIYTADGRKLKSEAKQGNEYIKEGTKTYSNNLVFDINDELDYILFNEGRILYNVDDNTFKYEYHLKDHLGSTRVAFVPTAQGTEVVQENSYYPFGAPINDLSWTPHSTNRYLREGKEYVSDFDWNKYDFTGRTFDSWTLRALQVDPMATQYYNVSPYALWVNNPIKFIDPDGKEIRLYNIIKLDHRGQAVVIRGLSSITESAIMDILKTKEGITFFAQFAKAGDVLGDYTFTKDGTLSNVMLNIWDYSYEKGEMPSYAQPKSGSIGVSDDKKTVTLKVVSNNSDKADIAETLTHETQIHGFDIPNKIIGTSTSSEDQDHKALKNKDVKHQGYKQYKSVQEQLQKIDEEYNRAFQEALRDAQQY